MALLATDRSEVVRQAEAAVVRETLIAEKAQALGRQVEDLGRRLAESVEALQFRDLALEEPRDSIASLVQQKDADARAHAKSMEGLAKDRERMEERNAARERRLLEDVDRARQESKALGKALAEAQSRAAKEHAELERENRTLGKTLEEARLQQARLQERLTGCEQRVRELQGSPSGNAARKSARARKRAVST